MSKGPRWRGVIAGVVLLSFAAAALLPTLDSVMESTLCKITLFQEREAPDKRFRAVVFEVDCGATTSFNTQVSVVPGRAPFSKDRHPPFLSVEGTHTVDLTWLGSDSLAVRIPPTGQVYRQEQPKAGVSVRYD